MNHHTTHITRITHITHTHIHNTHAGIFKMMLKDTYPTQTRTRTLRSHGKNINKEHLVAAPMVCQVTYMVCQVRSGDPMMAQVD